MNRFLFLTLILLGISLTTLQAQSPPSLSPSTQQPSFFDLNNILGLDLNELFNSESMRMLQEELESTKDIWGEFIDPSFMDTTMMRLNDPAFGMSLEALIEKLELNLNNEEGFGGMFQDLLKNLNMPLNAMPFNLNPGVLPEEFDGEGWEIIPNAPQQKPKKKGVSVI